MAPSVVPLSVVPNPPRGIVGHSVMLDIQGFPERALTYVWYRVSSGTLNQIAAYSVPAALQTPADIRERVLPNGSLLIPNLILSDMGGYMVQIVNFTSGEPLMVPGHLSVYDKSTVLGNDVSYPGGAFVVTVTVIYVVLAVLIVAFTRMSLGRACDDPTEKSDPQHPTTSENSDQTI